MSKQVLLYTGTLHGTCWIQENPGYVDIPLTASNSYNLFSNCKNIAGSKNVVVSFSGDPYTCNYTSCNVLDIN